MDATRTSMPIGIFDSGVGGLTVFDAISRALPNESLIYLGDTARVPYGTRSPETVRTYALRVASLLFQMGIKALVVACNTASTHGLEALKARAQPLGLPVLGVIKPGVERALASGSARRIAVLGTEGTIRGGAYQNALHTADPSLEVTAIACPLFVSLAEEGWTEGQVADLVAERYLSPLQSPDTVVLGCTHYPLLADVIAKQLPQSRLIDSATAVAGALSQLLSAQGLENPGNTPTTRRFLVTDNVERFRTVGRRFLSSALDPIELVDVTEPTAEFAEP